ncbi:hypothetical protein MGG_17994 [Pyricularia oryzae 70-15]|uniref:Uncharacterized protein n=3 Tax=Pyricularia oryzae TaxID=318829 RepID=G5EHT2_PYRO7|nr:uncharacterized protein MGG_17994 [Pyricularia oryzae 70-15]EAQ71012.1 hypothetical protein MGCH7_ch7g419 [Pyricularia oryzae 70-15]EHA46343.1 hypothetical protein MGG_17994 [Pyricularia oryzae 70-15]ELQ36251.1 hypothetical protein OOU_Y34scaffold00666g112 [Pyricularia oryzae Y34]
MDWPPLCNRLFGAGSDENPSGALTRCLSAGAFYLTLLLKFSLDEDTLASRSTDMAVGNIITIYCA